MNTSDILNRDFGWYILKFIAAFCLLYFGTLAIIGITVPGGYYSFFIDHYLNIIDWLRNSLLYATKGLLSLFNYETKFINKYKLRIIDGPAIRMVYSCIGYGVMSFWAAFIIANKCSVKKKVIWIFFGLMGIWCINVLRLTILLITLTKHLSLPFGLDEHSLFNVAAYILIFLLIYAFDRSSSTSLFKKHPTTKTF